MKKKNILIASYSLDFGGIETSLINLLKNMNQNKYNITLVLEKKEGVFLNDVPNNIVVKEYKVSNNKNLLIRKTINLIKEIKWILFNYKKYDASICYATYSKPCSFLARMSSNNKIMYVHSNYLNVYKKDKEKIKQFFYERNIFNYNKIVFVSNESKKDLVTFFPNIKKKSYVINNLVDYKKIMKLSNKKIKFNKNVKNVLFVGRLEEESKKISRIIELAKKMNNKDVFFWIIGDGPDREKYLELIKNNDLKNVELLGAKKNPYSYIKQCDVLILTSDYEGFPVVYNEAIVLETPILTTINVTDDYISIPNRFGYIAKKNVSDLKIKLEDILNHNFIVKEKVDFDKLNKKRISDIERLIDE